MSQLMHLSVMSSAISGRRVRLTGILALAEVAQQDAVIHVDLLGNRHVDHVAVARRGVDELALAVLHLLQVEAEVALGGHQLQAVAQQELVLHLDLDHVTVATCDLADELLGVGDGVTVVVVLVFAVVVTAQEALGVAAVGQVLEGAHQGRIEWTASHRIVDGLAIDLGGTGAVVEGLGTAFDFQRMNAHFGQALDVLDGAQILGVHDVGAVLVFKCGHELARAVGLFQQHQGIGRLACAQGRIHLLHGDGLLAVDDLAHVIFLALVHLVLPAAGVGAGALIGVTLVDVAGEQAAAGVGHAQRPVDEDFQFHLRHLHADLLDLVERQLAGEDGTGQSHLMPELHRGPVDRVGLHREVDRHVGEGFAHHHDEAGVGHDECIRLHIHHGAHVADEGLELGVVGLDVGHHIELLAEGMGLVDAELQILVIEFVVAYPQAVARLARIDGVCAIGIGVAHVLEGPGRGEQFWSEHVGLFYLIANQ